MTQQPFRLEPKLPVEAVKTYQVTAPLATHYRRATCVEVDCVHQAEGWQSGIDESTELGKQQAYYIRNQSGRHFTEDRNLLPGLTVFRFAAGQECFAGHVLPLERPALYIVRGGDWRGNPLGDIVRRKPDDWADDFANHQQQLADKINQG